MFTLIYVILIAVVLLLAGMLVILGCEIAASLCLWRSKERRVAENPDAPSMAILVPAHNEEQGLATTLESIRSHLRQQDRLVVVADNCTDKTAAIARDHGADVVERIDETRRGKGYAIEQGLAHLETDPPDVVVIIDADCCIERGQLTELARRAAKLNRPIQAAYLMDRGANAKPQQIVSGFAFFVRNVIRPLGLSRMRLPCLLTGSGMAFPWDLIVGRSLGGHIVEDMRLSIDLATRGFAPQYWPDLVLRSVLPDDPAAACAQRTRWEHGHLRLLVTEGPQLLRSGIRWRDLGVVAMALDLLVPPLSLLGAMTIIAGFISLIFGVALDRWAAFMLIIWPSLFATLMLGLGWARHGRDDYPLRTLAAAPVYLLRKLPIYLRYIGRPQREWVRTQRYGEQPVGQTRSPGARVSLRGVIIDSLAESQVLQRIFGSLDNDEGGWIITLNLQHLRQCEKQREYRNIVEEADLVVVDGMPLVWAARMQGAQLAGRVAGSDLVSSIGSRAAEKGRSIFFLGGAPGAADGAIKTLTQRYPALRVAGSHVPEYGFERSGAEIERIGRIIRDANPDIVYVALGTPKQERLIRELRSTAPKAWWVGVGISFSFLAGQLARAPRWMQCVGLEWVHRLCQEPRRLGRRYVLEGMPYVIRLFACSLIVGVNARVQALLRRRKPTAAQTSTGRQRRVLAVASGGGHWVELMRLMPAFEHEHVTFVTVNSAYRAERPDQKMYIVNDATRWNKLAVLFSAIRILFIMVRERPHVVVTTGAAPGYFAILFGRWLGARTIWVDSLANVEQLSMSGQMAGKHADLWLTQWPHLADSNGPQYAGAVL